MSMFLIHPLHKIRVFAVIVLRSIQVFVSFVIVIIIYYQYTLKYVRCNTIIITTLLYV